MPVRNAITVLIATAAIVFAAASAPAGNAFPGAVGFGSDTYGGLPTPEESTRVIKVTSLDAEGPGSLKAAIEQKGRRLIVFEVGGVIDLGGPDGVSRLVIADPHVTIAGHTAPSPGITIIRGDVLINTHDVVIRHIRVRPGDAGQPKRSGWAPDGISTGRNGHHVVVDHCSVSWAVDENMTTGAMSNADSDGDGDPELAGTSHHVTFSNCLVAEGLSHATHEKGEHSKGMLLMDGNRKISHIRNLLISNVGRNPMVSAAEAVLVNNFVQNFGKGRVIYARNGGHPSSHYVMSSRITSVGNVVVAGPDSRKRNVYIRAGNTAGRRKPAVKAYLRDNRFLEKDGSAIRKLRGNYDLKEKPLNWPDNLKALPSKKVPEHVLTNAGATPWDRDAVDKRLIRQARKNAGAFIDSQEEVGGYPNYEKTMRKLQVPADQAELREWLAGFEKDPKQISALRAFVPRDPTRPPRSQDTERATLKPVHDATVTGKNPEDKRNVTAGRRKGLHVRHCTDQVRNQKSYLRFRVPAREDDKQAVNAWLRIYWKRQDRGKRMYEVYVLNEAKEYGQGKLSATWNEEALNWKNAPANPVKATDPSLTKKHVTRVGTLKTPRTPGYLYAGGRRLAAALRNDTDGKLTVILVPANDDATLGRFGSSESENSPQLVVDHKADRGWRIAEGYGAKTAGGRDGRVLQVTNLKDYVPGKQDPIRGSLRAAVNAEGPRTVVFRTGGTIDLKKKLVIRNPRITIAGQTAPGGGICLKGAGVTINTGQVIVQYLRVRPGAVEARKAGREYQTDALSVNGRNPEHPPVHNIVIDHCSLSWGNDEVCSISGAGIDKVTVQWCLITESLNDSTHPKGEHGYGSIIATDGRVSFHHNVYAYHSLRTPRPGTYPKDATGDRRIILDFRQNYCFHGKGYTSSDACRVNFVNNIFEHNPFHASKTAEIYWKGNRIRAGGGLRNKGERVREPFPAPPVTFIPMDQLRQRLLKKAGAVVPQRDAVDKRVVSNIRKGKRYLIDTVTEVGAWPDLAEGEPPEDTDNDGLPDRWERDHGLDPKDPADRRKKTENGHTYLELWLHEQTFR